MYQETIATIAFEAARDFQIKNLEFVRAFDNIVYRGFMGQDIVYLRLTPQIRRSKNEIETEHLILRCLCTRGMAVNQPLPAKNGRCVLHYQAGVYIYFASVSSNCAASVFSEISSEHQENFFVEAGRTIGQLHRTLAHFQSPIQSPRPIWEQDRWHRFQELIPAEEVAAQQLYKKIRDWLKGDAVPSGFGLIHGDFTIDNIRFDGQQLQVFDFDLCCYHWYGYEIACFLHRFVTPETIEHHNITNLVLTGYAQTMSMDADFQAHLQNFALMKLLRSFLVHIDKWGLQKSSPQQKLFLETRRQQFVNGLDVWKK
jgi:amicoumacin kinase